MGWTLAVIPGVHRALKISVAALYGLDTRQAEQPKKKLLRGQAERFPSGADFIDEALVWHRSDLSEPHATTIRFVDFAVGSAERTQND